MPSCRLLSPSDCRRIGPGHLFRAIALSAILASVTALAADPPPAAGTKNAPKPAATETAPSPAADVTGPLTPAEELAAIRVEPGLRVELVAAEPTVESPVALAFDERGRMFVAENRGYPTGPEDIGRIVMLEDRDGDGTFERRTVFADGLSYPNGLMPWRGGLLVTCAPDILYLADTDGDGHSDRREVMFTGFSMQGTTQLRVSHPQLALDNWIYVTGGLTGGKVTSPLVPDHPAVEFGRADFRFQPDGKVFEAVDGGGQFGMSFDDFGHRFILYNRVQVQHVVMPERYLRRNPHLPATSVVEDCPADMTAEPLKGHGAAARLYPISKNITTADSHAGTFTAACGLLIYRSSHLPASYQGAAFTCDPTGNLVHYDRLEPSGATFVARRSEEKREFLASPDDWFRPVNLAEGPDGALYICDMYRKTIEHPDYLPVEVRKHTDFESGKGMGRIWRVRNAQPSGPDDGKTNRSDRPAQAWNGELGKQLRLPDRWWRARAQRLILEQGPQAAAGMRARPLSDSQPPAALVLGMGLVDTLGGLDDKTLAGFLGHANAGVRECAIVLAEPRLKTSPELARQVATLAGDPNPRVRFQCALTLGEVADPLVLDPLVRIALAGSDDRWTRLAVESSISGRELDFLARLAAAEKKESPDADIAAGNAQLLAELAQLIGAAAAVDDLPQALEAIVAAVRRRPFADQTAAISGFADALRQRHASSAASLAALARQSAQVGPYFEALLTESLKIAADDERPLERRIAAVRLLANGAAAAVGETLLGLVDPHQPSTLAAAAIHALGLLDDPAPATRLVEAARFASYSPPLREAVLSALMSTAALQSALLSAVESGAVPLGMIDSLRRKQLAGQKDPAIRERAAKAFAASAVGNRGVVYEDFKSVAAMPGKAAQGRQIFLKACANCHRLEREGTAVGPDLFGIRNQPKEAILLHILIPEYEITPGYGAYLVETGDGRLLAGLLVGETPTQITLRGALGREEIVLRSDIESLALSKLSLMPQELEKTMTRQDLADLLAYLKGEAQ